ncbi:MAG: hypothetical protein GDA49_03510 [Rhodospirillales bacterium]|nr:hypothetical protein [Rhodospirillales bacterium]
MAGRVYKNGRENKRALVYGKVKGTYTPETENNLIGTRRGGEIVDVGEDPLRIRNGEFFAVRNNNITSGLARLKIPSGVGSTIKPLQHLQQIDNFDFILTHRQGRELPRVPEFPFSQATLMEYVTLGNLFPDRPVIGNLTIAGDFSRLDGSDVSGTLTGIAAFLQQSHQFNGLLDGTITLTEGDTSIDTSVIGGSMIGIARDIGHLLGGASESDDVRVIVYGSLRGFSSRGETFGEFEGGAFYAIQNDSRN